MKKSSIILFSLFLLFVLSFSFLGEPASAKSSFGVMYLQELTGDEEMPWVGLLFRSLPNSNFGFGFELEGIIPLQVAQEAETTESIPYGQINPGLLVAFGNQFKVYGGANAIIAVAQEEFNFLTDCFYAKAGVQYDISFISIFAQGRTVVPISGDAGFDIFDRNGFEAGVCLSF